MRGSHSTRTPFETAIHRPNVRWVQPLPDASAIVVFETQRPSATRAYRYQDTGYHYQELVELLEALELLAPAAVL
jgi:hypothetical protein